MRMGTPSCLAWMFVLFVMYDDASTLAPSWSSPLPDENEVCESPALKRHRENRIRIGVILPLSGNHRFGIHLTRPAVEYARDYIIQKTDLLRNFSIEFDYRDSKCSETYGPLEAIDLYTKKSADLFLGPACDYAIAVVARFTKTWGIPIISAGAQAHAFSNKNVYGLLTRVLGSHNKFADYFVTVLAHFKYKNIGMLFYTNKNESTGGKSECWFIMEPIFLKTQEVINQKFDMKSVESFNEESTPADFEKHLKYLSKQCRVVILCASPQSVREIMIKAHDLNFDNGEYVFFNIDLFTSKNSSERPWYNASDTEERNEKAKKAYEALMTVTLRKPTNKTYMDFSRDVKNRAKTLYHNFTYGEDEVNSFVGAFHDAVILYAIALNESLADNISISNGSEITRRMWNRTFTGITGTVSIDENGDRNADYSLLDMDPVTSTFRVVANYYGNRKNYEPIANIDIHWAGNRAGPPPDTPECGFDGSKCPPEEPFPLYIIVIIVLGTVIILVLVISFFVYRNPFSKGLGVARIR